MADTHDTIDGLLAEFRGYSHGMPPSYHVTMSWADFRRMLDRFDAAHRREVATTKESLAVGNSGDCAKLREALKLCMDEMCNRCRDLAAARGNPRACIQGCEPVRKARAALAAPPRNCDVYNNESCRMAYHLHGDGLMTMQAFADWLYAPATEKEGGAK